MKIVTLFKAYLDSKRERTRPIHGIMLDVKPRRDYLEIELHFADDRALREVTYGAYAVERAAAASVTFSEESLPDLIEALQELQHKLNTRGYVPPKGVFRSPLSYKFGSSPTTTGGGLMAFRLDTDEPVSYSRYVEMSDDEKDALWKHTIPASTLYPFPEWAKATDEELKAYLDTFHKLGRGVTEETREKFKDLISMHSYEDSLTDPPTLITFDIGPEKVYENNVIGDMLPIPNVFGEAAPIVFGESVSAKDTSPTESKPIEDADTTEQPIR
jgi:hypothetical protein